MKDLSFGKHACTDLTTGGEMVPTTMEYNTGALCRGYDTIYMWARYTRSSTYETSK